MPDGSHVHALVLELVEGETLPQRISHAGALRARFHCSGWKYFGKPGLVSTRMLTMSARSCGVSFAYLRS